MKISNYLLSKNISHNNRLLWVTCLGITLGLAHSAQAETCRPNYTLGGEKLFLPCFDWLSEPPSLSREVYQAELQLENAESFLFRWDFTKLPIDSTNMNVGAIFDQNSYNLYIPTIDVETAPGVIQSYEVTLQGNAEGLFHIAGAKLLPSSSNLRPVADSISVQANLTLTYQQIQLTGNDPDGDTIAFELLAPTSGSGYNFAYLNAQNMLYVIVEPTFIGSIELPYRVTDGQLFSKPAAVTINVGDAPTGSFNLGSEKATSRDLAGHTRRTVAKLTTDSSGTSAQVSLPTRVDLSDQFPQPRHQGNQNSCVGWATAYALKSYQESAEMGWSLETTDHLFSPAYIYNQIKEGGGDNGSRLDKALQLIVDQGVATLQTMPYDENDVNTQPSPEAQQEAAQFKAREWGVLETTKDMKTALSEGLPVAISMAVYNSFLSLQGTSSVYNTPDTYVGEHAVTLVGYDDDKYGGSFKVINSWGTDWGDGGYFWLPYSFTTQKVKIDGQDSGFLISTAYILMDDQNQDVTFESTTPTTNMSNLVIVDWQASYDLKPGGQGIVWYTIENAGQKAIAANSVEVELVLTEKPKLFLRDYRYEEELYVLTNEIISYEIAAGEAVTRDNTTAVPFNFPELSSGDYYLHLVVDGYDHQSYQPLAESSKDDNISTAEAVLTMQNDNPLPDLEADYWYAEWDPISGEGHLDYTIINSGATSVPAGINWEIALFLVSEEEVDSSGNPKEFPLLKQAVAEEFSPLATGQDPKQQPAPFFISDQNPIAFNAYRDNLGNPIPQGHYEMVFRLDTEENGTGKVVELEEYNTFFSGLFVEVEFDDLHKPAEPGELEDFGFNPDQQPEFEHTIKPRPRRQDNSVPLMKAYNGKSLIKRMMRNQGGDNRRRLDEIETAPEQNLFEKTTRASTQFIYPVEIITSLPPIQ